MFSPLRLLSISACVRAQPNVSRLMLEWTVIVALLLFIGFAFKIDDLFPRRLILSWFALTPIALIVGDY